MGNKPHSHMAVVGGYKRRKCLAALPVRLFKSVKNEWMGLAVERVRGRVVVSAVLVVSVIVL